MNILITGITSNIGRMVAQILQQEGHRILGLDRRPWPDAPPNVKMFQVDIRKRPAENVFRTEKPEAAIHLATTTHFSTSTEERYRINLHGTRSFFDHCSQHDVKNALFIGRHTVYGAANDSPLYYTESDPPLAATTFPELADLVAADLYACSMLWQCPKISTGVLRFVYTLGPSRNGTLANFLSGKKVPSVMGFDPLFHFIHEQDAARAIVKALEKKVNGVFNVAGPQPVPLSLLCHVTKQKRVALPEFVYQSSLGKLGFPYLPAGSINHVKYPIVLDGSLFKEKTGFQELFDEVQTMQSFRWTA